MPETKKATTAKKAATPKSGSSASARRSKDGGSNRRSTLEIKIGVSQSPREIVLEVDLPADQIETALTDATSNGSTFSLTDVKGKRILLPADKVAYIEIGEPHQRRVGFGTP